MDARKYYGFSGWDGVASEFHAQIGPEPELVYAVYSTPAYEGNATVIFRRDGKWFEAGGGHCSCYGLEDQWEPKPLDVAVHLAAIADGKRYLLPYDSEGDYPEATPEAFDAWLREAVSQQVQ